MAKSPTMNDVARVAQVALKTVSRYVNGQTNINPELSGRIASAIEELGYRRNLAAAGLRPGQTTKTLGLIISDLANPYYSALTRAIETYASARGYLLFSASSDEDGQRHDELVDRMLQQQVDGLFIVPPRLPGRDWRSIRPPVPLIIFLDRPMNFEGSVSILADNAGGAFDATQVLIREGADRIAFIGDDLTLYTMNERYQGYRAALRVSKIDFDEKLVFTRAHSSEEAELAVRALLNDRSVDAIFAANNRAAIGSMIAFSHVGRRVRLIGFDDFEAALLSDPQVSVVSHDVGLEGTMAARLLIDSLSDGNGVERAPREATSITLPTIITLRGSERV